MARSYAKVLTSIWRDEDFLRLNAAAQRMYVLVLSQPDLSPVGVLTVAERRLADLAPDTTVAAIRKALGALQRASFLVIDSGTSEAWVRSFLHHDGVLTSPNVLKAAARSFTAVHSVTIREQILDQVPDHLREGFREGFRELSPKRLGELIREPHPEPSLDHPLIPLPHPEPSASDTGPSPAEPVNVEEEDDDTWSSKVADIAARYRLDRTTRAGHVIRMPSRWVAEVASQILADDLEDLLELRARKRSTAHEEAAVWLDSEARRVRPPCVACGDAGVIELADGTGAKCFECAPPVRAVS